MPRKKTPAKIGTLEEENAKAELVPKIITAAEVRNNLKSMMPLVLASMERTLKDELASPKDVLGIAKFIAEYGYPELSNKDPEEENGDCIIVEYEAQGQGT